MSLVQKLVRKNIENMAPYSSARDEYSGEDAIFLDANENPYDTGVNRYPDPTQLLLKAKIGQIKNIHYEKIFVGNGSDEAIDLLMRAFCEPGIDNIVSIKPTYGMYKVCADINGVEYRDCLLTKDYQIDKLGMMKLVDSRSKLLFLCTPNNPTSNRLFYNDIIFLLENFNGLIVVDEAYIDFSNERSLLEELENYPNLVILQTFSKAWGMAGVRLGMAFASREIIQLLSRIKYPYNINILTQRLAHVQLEMEAEKDDHVARILEQREYLRQRLSELPAIIEILSSDANFLMARFSNSKEVFKYLIEKKIIIRDRSHIPLCEGCLRITIGTKDENEALLRVLNEYYQK